MVALVRTQSQAFAYALFLLAGALIGLQTIPGVAAECHCATSTCYLAAYDEDGDGAINARERTKMNAAYDADKDGTIDEGERARMERDVHGHAGTSSPRSETCPEDAADPVFSLILRLLGGGGLVGGLVFFGRRRLTK